MGKYALGLDYGTNSCRSLLVDLMDGREIASCVFHYPSGEQGVLTDAADPNVARQSPADYLEGLEAIVTGAILQARAADEAFDTGDIVGIGIDTTGSTPLPVDRAGTPLALSPEFASRPAAQAWLWKDHTSHAEAALFTRVAAEHRPHYLAACGGVYSSEWFWSKILHCKAEAPDVFKAAFSFVEICDWLPAELSDNTDPLSLKRSICAAGHKACYGADWGGLPDAEFLGLLDPELAALRSRLYSQAYTADTRAGTLCSAWAARLGMRPGTPIAVGSFDAHMGAVGAGVRQGVLSKVLGTSTCDMMVQPNASHMQEIPGVCGVVDGSILPGMYGIEAGQSAVGDIFLWFVNTLVPEEYGHDRDSKFAALSKAAAALEPGQSGLLALDWNNGNRCILVDHRLSGLVLGQTLHTNAHEMYRALIEATAFGALAIVDRIEQYGVAVHEVVACGGLASRNPLLMQIYADVLNRPMKVSRSDQTCALGAAIFGAAAAGHASVLEVQSAVCATREEAFLPDTARAAIYRKLYVLYRELHDAFGLPGWNGSLAHVMKRLMDIRTEVYGKCLGGQDAR